MSMKSTIGSILLAIGGTALAELVPLEEQGLESVSAQSNGLTIDIDASSLNFTYSYTNNQNASEGSWVSGANAGSGDNAVGAGIGSGAGLVKFNGMTLDIGEVPGSTTRSISIGLPTSIELNRVNTGDYYIVSKTAGPDANTPPLKADIEQGRKLIGFKWNTPPPLDFSSDSAQVEAISGDFNAVQTHNFTPHTLQFRGQVHIFAN